jgi:hypothetical protein
VHVDYNVTWSWTWRCVYDSLLLLTVPGTHMATTLYSLTGSCGRCCMRLSCFWRSRFKMYRGGDSCEQHTTRTDCTIDKPIVRLLLTISYLVPASVFSEVVCGPIARCSHRHTVVQNRNAHRNDLSRLAAGSLVTNSYKICPELERPRDQRFCARSAPLV